jgi:5'-3' exonuclease
MAQLVDDERVVLLDRRRRITYDEPAVIAKWGVPPTAIPDWLALVGDSSDGYPGLPGWGAKSAAAVLARYGSLEAIPPRASAWDVKSLRGAPVLAQTLRERWDEVQLYRSLARLRTSEEGVEIPEVSVADLEWRGTPREAWQALCARLGLDGYTDRPHRWEAGGPAH